VAGGLEGLGAHVAVGRDGPLVGGHRDEPADAVVGPDQGSTRRLALPEAGQLSLERLGLGVGGFDHGVTGQDPLASSRADGQVGIGQMGTGLVGSYLAVGNGHPVVVQLGPDALNLVQVDEDRTQHHFAKPTTMV
jgi:hypothetical protein